MKIEDRIRQVMEYNELSPNAFSEMLEINRSGLSHLYSGRNKASLELVMKLLNKFPTIDINWLLHGKNQMFTEVKSENYSANTSEHLLQGNINTKNDFNQNDTNSNVGIQADLFSLPEQTNHSFQHEEEIISENIAVTHESSFHQQNFQDKTLEVPQEMYTENLDKPNQTTISEHNPLLNRDKKVKKIVFFYDDGKFEQFLP